MCIWVIFAKTAVCVCHLYAYVSVFWYVHAFVRDSGGLHAALMQLH